MNATGEKSRAAGVEAGLARRADAGAIAAMFEAALGEGGIMAPGHEPYPDPSLFSKAGVLETIDSPERQLVVVRVDGRPVGGMIVDRIHEHACEFNCMAVRRDARGLGYGSVLVEACRQLVDESYFVLNATELVTHSLASQAAHFAAGYGRVTGFGYCQYPRVFFKDRPESCLWGTRLQGRLARVLPGLRQALGWSLAVSSSELRLHIAAAGRELSGVSDYQAELCRDVMRRREIFVPESYAGLASQILGQFADTLDYSVNCAAPAARGQAADASFVVDVKEGSAHSYIYLPAAFDPRGGRDDLRQAIARLRAMGKRFILVRMRANYASTADAARFLQDEGFFFHTMVPLYMSTPGAAGAPPLLEDMLGMQWVAPQVVAENPLPGETGSVIQVWGYPEGISAAIIGMIRRELSCRQR